jgi:hypothetical protein
MTVQQSSVKHTLYVDRSKLTCNIETSTTFDIRLHAQYSRFLHTEDGQKFCKVYVNVRVGAVGWGTALKVGRSWVWFPLVSLESEFDSPWFHWNFSLTYSFRPHYGPGVDSASKKMSTRNISWGLKRPVRGDGNLTTFMCRLSWNLGASTSWNPLGLSRPLMGLLYLLCECTE